MKRTTATLIVPLVVALAATASSLLMISQAARSPDGSPALALDDSYIHLQYAWQTSQGHFLQYNTGDAPTTGATSLLYMLLLAGGFALGISRQAMPGVVLAFGGTLFVAAAVLLSDVGRRVADEIGRKPSWITGTLVGLLFAGSGWMAWAFLGGMETGLLILLVIGTLWTVIRGKPGLSAVLASLAALTRPEALILGVVLLASMWLIRHPAGANTHPRRLLWAFMPLTAALIPFAINYLLTGSLGSSGLLAKSLFTFVPFHPVQALKTMVSYAMEITLRVFGGPTPDGHWLAFPLAQFLSAIGTVLLWKQDNPTVRRFAMLSTGWALLGIGATTTLQTAKWHHYRYQMPFYPALITPLTVALVWAAEQIARRLKQRSLRAVPLALLTGIILWSSYSLIDYLPVYALDTKTLATQQIILARWLRDNTPPESHVAVHDVGTLRFLSERYTLDLIGLTTPDMASSYRNGPGSIYEVLEQTQPDYYTLYTDPDLSIFAALRASQLPGEELFRVTVVPFSAATSATSTQVITQPDWSGVALANLPQQPDILARIHGWTLVDRLDVADLADEPVHGYTWWNQGTPAGFPSDARKMSYRVDPTITLADGGRLMTGGESFTLKTRPGQPLLLIARLHQTTDMTLRVHINGTDAGQWRLPAIPGEWIESIFQVSADLISGDQARVTITVEKMFDASPESRYSPFHYWVYQGGETAPATAPPQNSSQAIFGDVVQLRGFNLPHLIDAPGNTLPLTLYWQAIDPPHANLRVFVHLVDPNRADSAEGIVAQADSAPHQGVYPFWVWQPGEAVSDTLLLTIPPDASPGQYLLLVGLYDAAAGQRLPITGGEDFGASRLLLTTIIVR